MLRAWKSKTRMEDPFSGNGSNGHTDASTISSIVEQRMNRQDCKDVGEKPSTWNQAEMLSTVLL